LANLHGIPAARLCFACRVCGRRRATWELVVDFWSVLSNNQDARFAPVQEVAISVLDLSLLRDADAAPIAEASSSRGDLLAAYADADRRCLSATASAHDFVVRADLSRALGDESSALADVQSALDQDPSDLAANLAALRWADAEGRMAAATQVIAIDGGSARGLREAIRVKLAGDGGIVHRLRPAGAGVSGWLAWPGQGPVKLGFLDSGGDWTVEVAPDWAHGLAGEGYAIVDIEVPEVQRVFDPRPVSATRRVDFRRPTGRSTSRFRRAVRHRADLRRFSGERGLSRIALCSAGHRLLDDPRRRRFAGCAAFRIG